LATVQVKSDELQPLLLVISDVPNLFHTVTVYVSILSPLSAGANHVTSTEVLVVLFTTAVGADGLSGLVYGVDASLAEDSPLCASSSPMDHRAITLNVYATPFSNVAAVASIVV
jgi:hypothetical protein